jgi:hypothetical protein
MVKISDVIGAADADEYKTSNCKSNQPRNLILGSGRTNLERTFEYLLDHVHVPGSKLRLKNKSLPRRWVVLVTVSCLKIQKIFTQLHEQHLWASVNTHP